MGFNLAFKGSMLQYFLLWWVLITKLYTNSPHTLRDLKVNIQCEFVNSDVERYKKMLVNVLEKESRHILPTIWTFSTLILVSDNCILQLIASSEKQRAINEFSLVTFVPRLTIHYVYSRQSSTPP
jgi:hypothetical protein